MASSEKPDFIEIAEKETPVKLTTGGLFGDDAASQSDDGTAQRQTSQPMHPSSSATDRSAVAGNPSNSPISGLKPHQIVNDDVANLRGQLPPGSSMSQLPGGTMFFIVLLAAVCYFGNQIDEMRNRTLTDFAKGISMNGRGFVQTAGDLGDTLIRHHNLDGAKAVYDKALFDLSSSGLDSGTKGAFVRLKLVEIAFANANIESSRGRKAQDSRTRREAFDRSWKYEAEAKSLANQASEMLSKDRVHVNTEIQFLLSNAGNNFEDWFDYKMAIKLNEQALNYWPKSWRNGRSYVDGKLGFEHLMVGNFLTAEEHLKNSLNWTMKNGSTRDNAWKLSILGRSQIDLKKYMDAEVNLNRAIEIWDDLNKNERNLDVDYARVYTDQGRVKAALGNSNEALKLFQKAESLLKEHPDYTFDSMRNHLAMANYYRDIGNFAQARDLYSDIIGRIDQGDEGPDRKSVMREWDLLRRLSGGR